MRRSVTPQGEIVMKRKIYFFAMLATIFVMKGCNQKNPLNDALAVGGKNDSAASPQKLSKAGKAPSGIFVVIKWNEEPQLETWKDPDADGVVIRTYWKYLNPDENLYQWDYLDKQFAMAGRFNKKIHLMISPRYVFENSDVDRARFTNPQEDKPDDGEEKRRLLPLPWDKTYLRLWFDFVDKVAQQYGHRPELAIISTTGPNSHNGELSLPREEKDDLQKWLDLVDNKELLLAEQMREAWQKTMNHFHQAFPGKHFTLGINLKSLPLHLTERNFEIIKNYDEALAKYGYDNFPAVFGLQSNGLDGRPFDPTATEPQPQWRLLRRYSDKILTGFQTRASNNLFDGDRAKKQEIFRQTLQNGIAYGARFLEIYEGSLRDESLRSIIVEARNKLRN
jgi:hypothetical protein